MQKRLVATTILTLAAVLSTTGQAAMAAEGTKLRRGKHIGKVSSTLQKKDSASAKAATSTPTTPGLKR